MSANQNKIKDNSLRLYTSIWVLSLYFIEGLPYTLVNNVSGTLFKTMQVSNSDIGLYTSLFYIPWAIKFIWAPFIDRTNSRRNWIIVLQLILGILILVLSLGIFSSQSFKTLIYLFALIAFISATYDIACDGFYLDVLSKAEQSLYVGWRNTAYKIAWLFGMGFLVSMAGKIANLSGNCVAWTLAFVLAGAIFLTAALLNSFILPIDKQTKNAKAVNGTILPHFQTAFISFFKQPKILLILCWILIFRAGDALLLKMAQPFFLDSHSKGGLALHLEEVGFIYGTIGTGCLLIGGIIGGWLVFRYGLKKCLFPTAIIQSLTLLLYWLLAIYQPNAPIIALANAFEQFAYGLAVAAYTSYLFTIVKEDFLASHYAIATGFMAIGMILPGAASGYLVDSLGYQQFFLISFFCSIPGIICTLKLPFAKSNPV